MAAQLASRRWLAPEAQANAAHLLFRAKREIREYVLNARSSLTACSSWLIVAQKRQCLNVMWVQRLASFVRNMVAEWTGLRLLKWGIFTVLVSLIPFVMVALTLWSDDKDISLSALWPHGELLLVSTALAADAVGSLIPTAPRWERSKIVSAGACIVLLIVTAFWYALIQNHPEFKIAKISKGTMELFVFTVIVCACCKYLAEK